LVILIKKEVKEEAAEHMIVLSGFIFSRLKN